MQELIELKRLGDELGRAAFDRLDRVLDGAEAGHDDTHDLGVALDRGTEHFPAVYAWKAEIGQHHVEREFAESFDRLLSAGDRDDLVLVVNQAFGRGLS